MNRPARESTEQHLELPGLVRDKVAEGRAKARATRARKQAEAEITDHLPVAQLLLDLQPTHLDRTFDYAVPASMAADAVPGARVKVRFAGQDVDGFVLARLEASEHEGRLAPLKRVVSAEPVLSPAIAGLAADLAERYAGTRSDLLRLAVPPRHAAVEKEASDAPPAASLDPSALAAAWAGHEPGAAFLRHLAAGGSPRAVWHAAAGTDWALLLASAVGAVGSGGRGAVVCVPDGKDVARLSAALDTVLGPGRHVTLTADSGPAARYRSFLAVARGAVRVAIGTRAAAFAPVHDLGLVAVWDDGDDLLAEPRAPYPHARETLLLRAEREGAAALVGGFARTVEADQLLRSGWAQEIAPTRTFARERVRVAITGASDFSLDRDPLTRASRVPREVHQAIRAALEEGPVLVQTPRRGYAAALACERCRTPARCTVCTGPLRLTGPATPPACTWCGTVAEHWACPVCDYRGLRAPVLGDARTAEELGRAFPGVRVVTSSGERVLPSVPAERAIVVATPGAEPVAAEGYASVVLLDTWLLLGRPDLRTEEEALRRWSAAIALAAPGGRAVVVGDPAHPALQALVRWDQPGFARREAEQRAEAHLPPASRLATITGDAGALDDALTLLAAPASAEVLGPVPVAEEQWRAVVRVPRAEGAALSRALLELQRLRSSRKLDPVRVQVDPPTL
ncbi:primosomal protein N' [Nocardioides sp. CER19]|uniref:primosomal protein N' n=1 Tax=Nocardioides sp. CER19 TaxID=3038538 RepID=UPI002449211C|nr:primosomal protein N' [Nocardioides sp. CER19]MDH2416395.1 primosomal protein N' [Nocardioides sp. CER19]